MNKEFIMALEEITKEKGISKDVIYDALEAALVSSYKKNYGTNQNAKVEIDRETGNISVYTELNVVEEAEDEYKEISVAMAKVEDPFLEIGDVYRKEITPSKFGRIAAQTAKQVVIQRIKDAERDVIYQDFVDRENELITGQIQRINKNKWRNF